MGFRRNDRVGRHDARCRLEGEGIHRQVRSERRQRRREAERRVQRHGNDARTARPRGLRLRRMVQRRNAVRLRRGDHGRRHAHGKVEPARVFHLLCPWRRHECGGQSFGIHRRERYDHARRPDEGGLYLCRLVRRRRKRQSRHADRGGQQGQYHAVCRMAGKFFRGGFRCERRHARRRRYAEGHGGRHGRLCGTRARELPVRGLVHGRGAHRAVRLQNACHGQLNALCKVAPSGRYGRYGERYGRHGQLRRRL